MKFFYLLLSIIVLNSCSTNNKKLENIEGDWVGERDISSNNFIQRRLVYSFTGSSSKFPDPYSEYTHYLLEGETLNIYALEDSFFTTRINHYLILKYNLDSLVLSHKDVSKNKIEIIRLTKIKPQNSLHPSKIYFSSSGCFGPCPSMFLEIDSTGVAKFYGRSNTDSLGFYLGKLSNSQYDILVSKIHNLKLDSIKKCYEAAWTDDQTSGINIISGSREYISTAYGYDKEPIELRILLNHLMELYKKINLKKDTLINYKYILYNKFNKLIQEVSPPLVPPPPQYKKRH